MGGEASKLGKRLRAWTTIMLGALAISCATSTSVPEGSASANATAARAANGTAPASSTASSTSAAAPSASAAKEKEAERVRYADLVNDLSEPDTYFFSDNLISNETSFLQIASELKKRADPAGVYIGVGPEQNFSYIALTKPSVAFVVDIRRANMLVHLLYRAAFEEAEGRAQFLALVIGRDPAKVPATPATAGVADVLAAAQKPDASKSSFEAVHARLMKRIEGYGVKLEDKDRKALEKTHQTFFEEGVKIRFELKQANGRTYPTLEQLLETTSPDGANGSFLATDESFQVVQQMERAGRIVPLVGDFAGDRALPQLASYLKTENRRVSTFYVSNVEQYLLEPKTWAKWVRNVKALPKTDDALFVRAYLDQGKKHPAQMKGHRTATVLAKMADFESLYGDKPTTTFWKLCTEKNVAPAT